MSYCNRGSSLPGKIMNVGACWRLKIIGLLVMLMANTGFAHFLVQTIFCFMKSSLNSCKEILVSSMLDFMSQAQVDLTNCEILQLSTVCKKSSLIVINYHLLTKSQCPACSGGME